MPLLFLAVAALNALAAVGFAILAVSKSSGWYAASAVLYVTMTVGMLVLSRSVRQHADTQR